MEMLYHYKKQKANNLPHISERYMIKSENR